MPNLSRREKNALTRAAAGYSYKTEHGASNPTIFFCPEPGSRVEYAVPTLQQREELTIRAHNLGHFGITSTLSRLRDDFRVYWPSMQHMVESVVRSCGTCLQFRLAPAPQPSALSSDIPGLFHCVAMDLVFGLPLTAEGFHGVMVLTEHLSRYPVAFPIKTKSAAEIAPLRLHYIAIFGAPRQILSDQGSEFINSVVSSLLRGIGVDRRVTSPYHPRANGITERFNATLIAALECHAKDHPDRWHEMLDFVLFAYRTRVHSSTNRTPFEVMFGRPHNGFLNFIDCVAMDTAPEVAILNRSQEIRYQLETGLPAAIQQTRVSQARQRAQQDKAHSHQLVTETLPIGSVVFLRSLAMRKKLSGPRFLGPYKVHRVCGGRNYQLVSPDGKLLKRSCPLDQLRTIATDVAANIWSQAITNSRDILYPVDRILDHRVAGVGGGREYLVRWSGFSHEFDSWEPESQIAHPDIISQYWGLPYSAAAEVSVSS